MLQLNGKYIPISQNGNIEIEVQDQYTDLIDYYLTRHLHNLTLSSDITFESYTIQVTDGSSVANGTYIMIQENMRVFQAKILSGGGTNTLTLDTPCDYPFTAAAASINNVTPELDVNASITPVEATLKPAAGVSWDITRIIISMVHLGPADDGMFGDLAALTKGVILRKSNGIHHTIFNAKTNGELRERMYDVTYSDKAPAGQYGTSGRRTFGGQSRNGVTIRLDGDSGDELQILIQDDLTGLTTFRIIAQGHIVI